jgi:ATP-dependent helicase/nuclease subunit B
VFDQAAHRILEELQGYLPDLSAAIVLLPHRHAAGPLASALARISGLRAIIPPHFLTLADWADAAPIASDICPDSVRQSTLYHALKSRQWFDEVDLWPMTHQLLVLFDELTLNQVALPASSDMFIEALARAYRTRSSQPLRFEARLVHDMWYALYRDNMLNRAARHGAGLAWQASRVSAPVFTFGLSRLSRLERAAVERTAEHAPLIPLHSHLTEDPIYRTLTAAWPDVQDRPLLSRAHRLAGDLPINPLVERIRLFGACHLEEEAEAAALQIRVWLAQGRRAIGLIAQDRLAARRVRALLERLQIRVRDETGWQLSTTSAASLVMTWVTAVTQRFRFETVLALLKSPQVLTEEPLRRDAACQQMERALIGYGPAHGIAELMQRLRQAEPAHAVDAARTVLARLIEAARPLEARVRPLAVWLGALLESLAALRTCLEVDAAGAQVLGLLRRRIEELRQDAIGYSQAEFRRWLQGELEGATFVDPNIDSPVVFTHLAAATLRPFQGVILLGAEADRLPGAAPAGFFNQQTRAELGLPGHVDNLKETQADLVTLLCQSPDTLVIWRARDVGEPVAVSPWFERLDTLSKLAWGDNLHDRSLAGWIASLNATPPPRAGTPRPAPQAHQIPASISVSAYNSLIACPYQYFARHVLKLNEAEEIDAEIDKSDYGTLVHQILARFHQRHPVFSHIPDATLITDLQQETKAAFADLEARDWFSQAWRLRWEARIEGYIHWQKAREHDGWRWWQSELKGARALPLSSGRSITLYGRMDRIDRCENGLAVLDYKTEASQRLKEKHQSQGEDVQLAAYALLLDLEVRECGFVSLEDDGGPKLLTSDPGNAACEARRLVELFEEIHAGAHLPAQGIEQVCVTCEMRGLCRRDYWPDEPTHG